jgi:dipeptidyl aminopeptidase/acylaminoacyl peptidase
MKACHFLIAFLFTGFCQAQSIEHLRISPQADYLVFIRNGDSLFLDELPQNKKEPTPLFLGRGLKENFNQRFLQWSPDQNYLIWESEGRLFQYSIASKTTLTADLSSLILGKDFRIDQVVYSNREVVYFSAGPSDQPELFALYAFDFTTRELQELARQEGDIANVALTADGKILAYSEYRFEEEQYRSRIHFIHPKSRMPLGESTWYDKVFFNRLSFSDSGKLLCRNVYGKAYVFELPELEDFLEEVASPEPEGVFFLRYFGEEILSTEQGVSGRVYKMRDQSGKPLRKLGQLRQGEQAYFDQKGQLYLSYENGVQPKRVYRLQDQREGLYSFLGENPLDSIAYEIFTYEGQGGLQQQSFIYGAGQTGLFILPYGGYKDRYPQLTYFLNELAFSLVQEGYRLVFLNTNGYANKRLGKDYGRAQLADTELFLDQWKDQKGLNLPVYLLGHSHGATLVYYYLTHSNRFRAGIAINGASDWIKQAELNRMTGLPREMGGTPEEVPEVYRAASPDLNIEKKMPPLLLVSGAQDRQIPAEINALAFYKKARKKRAKVRQLHFEEEGHLIKKQKNKDNLREEVLRLLKKYR